MSSRILIYAQVPPPMHGQSVMVEHLLTGLRRAQQDDLAEPDKTGVQPGAPLSFHHINPQISEDLADIGRWRPRKLLLVFRFVAEAIKARFRYRLDTFYFVPAPPKREGMYRDWFVLFLCRPFFRRTVFHWHCIGQPEFIEKKLSPWERFFARLFYRGADLSIVLSNYSRDEAAYFSSLRTVVIPNGIPDPCPNFDQTIWPERRQRIEARSVYEVLFMAGRMAPKGLFDAMAAVTRVNRILAAGNMALRMRLTVAGPFEDEAERKRYDQAAKELDATRLPGTNAALAHYSGWADDARKDQLYRQADCFLFPTTYPAESFGLVLAEAMAHGCAVITTRWQAVPEVLPGGYVNLVDPHDIEGMASALLRCANGLPDRSLRDYFLARFTSQRFAAAMIEALAQ